jgi:hypothetical protein
MLISRSKIPPVSTNREHLFSFSWGGLGTRTFFVDGAGWVLRGLDFEEREYGCFLGLGSAAKHLSTVVNIPAFSIDELELEEL